MNANALFPNSRSARWRAALGGLLFAAVTSTGSAGATVSLGSASGGAAESQRTFPFPAASGVLVISYQMYDVPDAMNVYSAGAVLASTSGRVQGSGTIRVPIALATAATVIVNPGNGLPGTAWDYSVSFTIGDEIPAISGWEGTVAGQTQDLSKPGLGMWGDPVDVGSGAHVVDWPVMTVAGARELTLRVGYNSLFSNFAILGRGWHHNFESRLSFPEGGAVYLHPHAAELHAYRQDTPGAYVCNDLASRGNLLAKNADASYTLTRADQSKLVFDATGALVQEIDPQGRAVVLTRASGRVTRITEPVSGVYLNFEYNPEGFLTRVVDNSGRTVRFSHDAGLEGKLVGMSLPHTGSPASPPSWQFTYNKDGQLERGTDPDGKVAFINYYDDKGRVASQDDGRTETETTKFLYDETSFPGRLTTTVVDRNQSTVRFTLDTEYRLVSRMDQSGAQTTMTYDPLTQNLTLSEAPLSRIHRFVYDAKGNLTRLTTPDGAVTAYTYDSRNNLASITDALGKVTSYAWDTFNRPSQLSLPDGSISRIQSTSGAAVASVTSAGGRRTTLDYASGRVSSVTDASGVVTRFSYDAIGRRTGVTLGSGGTYTYAFDANDNIISVTSPLGRTGTMTYNARRQRLSATEPTGAVTRYAYDGNGNLIEETDPLGAKTRYEFDPEDRLVAVVDATGGRFARTLDRAGRTTAVTDALGNVTRYSLDTVGNILRVTDPLSRTVAQFTYDLNDRIVSEVDALGGTTTYAYDALGRPLRATDPLGRVRHYTFDARSRLTALTNPAGETVRQLFDADDRIMGVADARGYVVDYEFDPAGQPTLITTAEGNSRRLTYDVAGRLASVVRPSGATTTLTYDADSRISRLADPEGAFDLVYDGSGRVTGIRVGTNTLTSQTYDAAGRRLTYRDSANAQVSYAWDAMGRLTRLTYPSGRSVDYAYDLAGRLVTVTDWAGRVTRYTWDQNGRQTKVERANGTSQTRTHDAKGQLTQLRELGVGATVIAEWTFTYDAAGQLTGETLSPAAPSWLPKLATVTVARDNRVVSVNGQVVQVDADGQLRRGPLPEGSTVDFVFNSRGRLTSAGPVSYTYDALGQRAGLTQGATSTRFVHDPGSRIPRVLAAIAGATTTEYVYGLGLLHEETGGQVRYYHFDRRGNTIALTDTTGVVRGRAYYGDWGEDAGSTGDMAVRFRFHGELGVQTDPNGLLLMGARYYHPTLRRFISADPVEFWGGVNWYAFADNNPISNRDPLGLWVESGHAPLTSHAISKVGGFTPQDFQTMMAGNSYVDRALNHIGDKPNAEHNMPGADRIANEGIAFKIKRAVQLEMEGKHNEAMWILGSGMHTAQDINHNMSPDPSLVRHAWGTRLGLGYDPDDPGQNMAAWARAQRESIEYLQVFKAHLEAARQGRPLRVGWKGVFK